MRHLMSLHRFLERVGIARPLRLSSTVLWVIASAVMYFPDAQSAGAQSSRRSSQFYVSPSGSDLNNGSAARPWLTIAHAASVVHAGATVHVAPGVYFGSLVTSVSGTARAPVRFLSETRWAAHVVGNGNSEAAWKNRGDYVDILGFDVSGAVANGIENLGSFARIIGNRVHGMTVPCNENGGAGITNANYDAHDNEVVANLVYGVRLSIPCPKHHGVGIYHSNARGHIFNNIVFSNGLVGIQLWHAATEVVVSNNTVFNNEVSGIIVGAGDEPSGSVNDHTVVMNNISVNNGAFGIQEFGSVGAHNIVSNNLVYGNRSGNVQVIKAATSATITRDPDFVRYTGESSGDYHLSATSPARDAGLSVDAPLQDFDGATRPSGKAHDLGAYEVGSAPIAWPWR